MRPALVFFAILVPILSFAAEVRANDHGAKGDGITLNTAAIQKALDAASANGGTVVFSPGIYMTGALFLKSGTTLRLDAGVELHAIQAPSFSLVTKEIHSRAQAR